MEDVLNGTVKNFFTVINIQIDKAMNLEKKAAPKKFKKFLIVRNHDIIKPIADFAAHPTNHPSDSNVCRFDQLKSEILHVFKTNNDAFCIVIELNLQKNGESFVLEDFLWTPSFN